MVTVPLPAAAVMMAVPPRPIPPLPPLPPRLPLVPVPPAPPAPPALMVAKPLSSILPATIRIVLGPRSLLAAKIVAQPPVPLPPAAP